MKEISSKDLDKIQKAKSSLILDSVLSFYATILYRLDMKIEKTDFKVLTIENGKEVEKEIPTMATDGLSILIDPRWIEGKTVEEIRGVLIHEAWHIIAKHHIRFAELCSNKHEFALEIWNIAADLTIDPVLHKAGLLNNPNLEKIVKSFNIRLSEVEGKTAEEIYELLLQRNNIKQILVASEKMNQHGMVKPYPKKGNGDLKKASQQVDMMVSQAYAASKMQGSVPAEVERLMDRLRRARLPWREILARFITTTVKDDYSWKLPNKKWIQQGFYLPSLYSQEVGKIVFLADTSGSQGKKEITECASEIMGILSMFPKLELLIIYVDSHVAGHEVITQNDVPLNLHPKGGGGTDYKPGFEWLQEQGIEPLCVIYYTDGYCDSFPREIPDYPVLWILGSTTSNDETNWKTPFGEVIKIY